MESSFANELWESEEIQYAYNMRNYEVIDKNKDLDICFIFFSSNGIYYPNAIAEFKEKIIFDNIYEWKNVAESSVLASHAGKYIFVRDIYKQWYVKGINSNIDTIDKLYTKLLELTEGYKVITVGSSAGGYAAVLLGIMLNAVRIYSFSGQFSIESEVSDYKELTKYSKDCNRSRYYNLLPLILENSHIPIYYFYPAYCKQDAEQEKMVNEIDNVYSIAMENKEHGKTLTGKTFPYVLIKTNDEMQNVFLKCKGEIVSKEKFEIIINV